MDNELPFRVLEILRRLYDERPTGVLSTPEIANILKISVKEAQGALIYLKEKEMINSYQDFDNQWVQKISAKGIDELNFTYKDNDDSGKQILPALKINHHNLIAKFNHCLSELDDLGKPLTDIQKMLQPRYTINVNHTKLHQVYGQIKNLLKYAFTDGLERSRRFEQDYADHCEQKRYVRNAFHPWEEEETDFKYRKTWLRSRTLEYINEIKIIGEIQSLEIPTDFSTNSNVSNSDSNNEKPLKLDVIHEDHTGKIKVFISHKFVESDQKLADTLRKSLGDHDIYGYLAERKKEYDLVFGEKIKNDIKSSDYLIAIITKNSQFAPSIHQEIGYALGVNVPVRIMAEEKEAKGVLVEGKDIEVFSRANFEQYLENIIHDVKKLGIRKKLDKTEREELIKNVYEPCYNQMKNVFDKRNSDYSIPPNPWKDKVSHTWKLKTEEDIKELFEIFSEDQQKYHRMWVNYSNKLNGNNLLGKIFKPSFEKLHMLTESGVIPLSGNASMGLDQFLENFKDVIFNDTVKDADEFYDLLHEYAENSHRSLVILVENWKHEHPEIFSEIIQYIPELVQEMNLDFTYSQIEQHRKKLKKSIEELTFALEEKLK